jgi:hypothetical protein
MVGIIAGFVTCDDKKTHLILVSNLLREFMVYTVEKLSFINGALTTVQVVDSGEDNNKTDLKTLSSGICIPGSIAVS